jgi:phospholipid:diacylglycerol acyltransferase
MILMRKARIFNGKPAVSSNATGEKIAVSFNDSFEHIPQLGEAEYDNSFQEVIRSHFAVGRIWMLSAFVAILFSIRMSNCGMIEETSIDTIFNSTGFPQLDLHWKRIQQSMRNQNSERSLPGIELAKEGARAHFPIVMIPGFVTSGLELWEGEECAKKYFRQRLWGSLGTARSFFTETDCWRRHLSLDPLTGLDPEGIRLRAAQGFDAADYFMPGYWVWNKLIENLAAIGYDGSTMSMESYDWRLSFPLLEERDGYLTKLKNKIEAIHKTTDRKVVILSHSMGSTLMTYFFSWVTNSERKGGGGGGRRWVEKHVHALINIAGPMLGVPKSVPSILSGEMKDTNILMGTFGAMVEQFFGRRHRKDLWSSWGSLWAMLPKGGHRIWDSGADLISESNFTDKPLAFIEFTDELHAGIDTDSCFGRKGHDSVSCVVSTYSKKAKWSVDETLSFLSKWGAGLGPGHAGPIYNLLKEPMSKWIDPTRTPVPYAPSLKIYCFYGVGLETERSFFYKRNQEQIEYENSLNFTIPLDLPFVMDGALEISNEVKYGVRMSDGDASVPLLSLGYMCVEGWKNSYLNPALSQVTTREYLHQHEFVVDDPMRGGPKSADHVDILGNIDMTGDVLRIVTNFDTEKVGNKIISDVENIVSRIKAHAESQTRR